MGELVVLAVVLVAALVLVSRWATKTSPPIHELLAKRDPDEVVLREFEGSGRYKVMRASTCPPRPTPFTAKGYNETRTQIQNLQALLVNPHLEFFDGERARWHTSLAGLIDQLDGLVRSSEDSHADAERFTRLKRQVEAIALEINRHKCDATTQASA